MISGGFAVVSVLCIERLRYQAVVDGIGDGSTGPDTTGPSAPTP